MKVDEEWKHGKSPLVGPSFISTQQTEQKTQIKVDEVNKKLKPRSLRWSKARCNLL